MLNSNIYDKIKLIKETDWSEQWVNEEYNHIKEHKYFTINFKILVNKIR